MSDIIKNDLLTIVEQQDLLRCLDTKLEQIELLLYRMEALARQAAGDISDMERENYQKKIEWLKDEIDKAAENLPVL